jgi:hypothetical protein
MKNDRQGWSRAYHFHRDESLTITQAMKLRQGNDPRAGDLHCCRECYFSSTGDRLITVKEAYDGSTRAHFRRWKSRGGTATTQSKCSKFSHAASKRETMDYGYYFSQFEDYLNGLIGKGEPYIVSSVGRGKGIFEPDFILDHEENEWGLSQTFVTIIDENKKRNRRLKSYNQSNVIDGRNINIIIVISEYTVVQLDDFKRGGIDKFEIFWGKSVRDYEISRCQEYYDLVIPSDILRSVTNILKIKDAFENEKHEMERKKQEMERKKQEMEREKKAKEKKIAEEKELEKVLEKEAALRYNELHKQIARYIDLEVEKVNDKLDAYLRQTDEQLPTSSRIKNLKDMYLLAHGWISVSFKFDFWGDDYTEVHRMVYNHKIFKQKELCSMIDSVCMNKELGHSCFPANNRAAILLCQKIVSIMIDELNRHQKTHSETYELANELLVVIKRFQRWRGIRSVGRRIWLHNTIQRESRKFQGMGWRVEDSLDVRKSLIEMLNIWDRNNGDVEIDYYEEGLLESSDLSENYPQLPLFVEELISKKVEIVFGSILSNSGQSELEDFWSTNKDAWVKLGFSEWIK